MRTGVVYVDAIMACLHLHTFPPPTTAAAMAAGTAPPAAGPGTAGRTAEQESYTSYRPPPERERGRANASDSDEEPDETPPALDTVSPEDEEPAPPGVATPPAADREPAPEAEAEAEAEGETEPGVGEPADEALAVEPAPPEAPVRAPADGPPEVALWLLRDRPLWPATWPDDADDVREATARPAPSTTGATLTNAIGIDRAVSCDPQGGSETLDVDG